MHQIGMRPPGIYTYFTAFLLLIFGLHISLYSAHPIADAAPGFGLVLPHQFASGTCRMEVHQFHEILLKDTTLSNYTDQSLDWLAEDSEFTPPTVEGQLTNEEIYGIRKYSLARINLFDSDGEPMNNITNYQQCYAAYWDDTTGYLCYFTSLIPNGPEYVIFRRGISQGKNIKELGLPKIAVTDFENANIPQDQIQRRDWITIVGHDKRPRAAIWYEQEGDNTEYHHTTPWGEWKISKWTLRDRVQISKDVWRFKPPYENAILAQVIYDILLIITCSSYSALI
ncbi:hypothetical protein ABW21_db0201627 [Orbilia brochopaga]|nr:hypothetical protein ABW21_db0201627 [Drechslerella brochopaga]